MSQYNLASLQRISSKHHFTYFLDKNLSVKPQAIATRNLSHEVVNE
ncbi:hypothetical protein ACTXKB_09335 [Psychrobacter aquimaris]